LSIIVQDSSVICNPNAKPDSGQKSIHKMESRYFITFAIMVVTKRKKTEMTVQVLTLTRIPT
jgi:hypothetical protein